MEGLAMMSEASVEGDHLVRAGHLAREFHGRSQGVGDHRVLHELQFVESRLSMSAWSRPTTTWARAGARLIWEARARPG